MMKKFLCTLIVLTLMFSTVCTAEDDIAEDVVEPVAEETVTEETVNVEAIANDVSLEVPEELPEETSQDPALPVTDNVITDAVGSSETDEQTPVPEENEVIAAELPAMYIDVQEITLGVKESYTIPVSFNDAEPHELTYTSSNSKYVKVSAEGIITAAKRGNATVSVSDGSNVIDITVHVKKAPSKITLSAKKVCLGVGETNSLSANIKSNTASKLTWSIDNESVASVSETGEIKAVSPGTAKLTVSTFNNKRATALIQVFPAPESVTMEDTMTLGVGQTSTINAELTEGSYGKITWGSSDPSIVTVNENGTLKAISEGEAIISAQTYNDLYTQCTVTVKPAPSYLKLSYSSITIGVGESITVPILYDENCEPGITWATSKSKYATVSCDGTVTGKKAGTAKITARTYNGKKVTFKVVVKKSATAISLIPQNMSLGVGETAKFTVSATNKAAANTILSSSDPNVADVSPDGTVIALSEGNVQITAVSAVGCVAISQITVGPAPTAIKLEPEILNMNVKQKKTLNCRLEGGSGSYTYSTSNKSIATVDSTGTVTAKKKGSCVIRVTAYNGLYADCTVNVLSTVKSISFADNSVTMSSGETIDIPELCFSPAGSTASDIYFVSSDPQIACVNDNGTITAISAGSCVITAQTWNGKKAALQLTVVDNALALLVEPISPILPLGASCTLSTYYDNGIECTCLIASNDTSIVTVLEDGITIFGNYPGETTLTVTAPNGLTKTISVTVSASEDAFSLDTASVGLYAGETYQLVPQTTVISGEAVTYSSSDTAVAKVSEDGLITAVAAGTCIISAVTENGFTADCTVKVNRSIIDLSHYNTVTDFDILADNVSFVILRATCGTAKDNKFAQYATELRSRGVPFGVYCYGKATTEAEAQIEAAFLCETASGYGPKFYVYDAEKDCLTSDIISAFEEKIRSFSGVKKVGCYVAHHLYKTYGFASISDKFDFVWIPRYGKNDGTLANSTLPSYTCDLWQYTSKGSIAGVSGNVDLDRVTGSGRSISWFMN